MLTPGGNTEWGPGESVKLGLKVRRPFTVTSPVVMFARRQGTGDFDYPEPQWTLLQGDGVVGSVGASGLEWLQTGWLFYHHLLMCLGHKLINKDFKWQ